MLHVIASQTANSPISSSDKTLMDYIKSREVYRSDSMSILVDAFCRVRTYLDYCQRSAEQGSSDSVNKRTFTPLFFLSHFHSDHYSGITKGWRHGTIYASRGTANMISHCLGVEETYLKPMDFGKTYVFSLDDGSLCSEEVNLAHDNCKENSKSDITDSILHDVDDDSKSHQGGFDWVRTQQMRKENCFAVTMVPANHCPGAAMLVFYSSVFGIILHTGDFRFSKDDQREEGQTYQRRPDWEFCIRKDPIMRSIAARVDVLFLDNTFCDPRFDFPSRTDSLREVNQTLLSFFGTLQKQASVGGVHLAVLIGTYTIGKERIALSIQETFPAAKRQKLVANESTDFVPTYVSSERYESICQLQFYPDRFVPLPSCEKDDVSEMKGFDKHEVILPLQPQSTARDLFTSPECETQEEVSRCFLTIFLVPLSSLSYSALSTAYGKGVHSKRQRQDDESNLADVNEFHGDNTMSSASGECLPFWSKKVLNLAQFDGVLCVQPSGWARKTRRQKITERVLLLHVPYSEHCSFSEMMEFVGYVNPSRVIPSVSAEMYKKHESLFAEKAPRLRQQYSNTQPIRRFMNPNSDAKGVNLTSYVIHKQRNPFESTSNTLSKQTCIHGEETKDEIHSMIPFSLGATKVSENTQMEVESVNLPKDLMRCHVNIKKEVTSEKSLTQWFRNTRKGNIWEDNHRVVHRIPQEVEKKEEEEDDCVIISVKPSIIEVNDSSSQEE